MNTQTNHKSASKAINIALWSLQVLVAAAFLMAGFGKLSGQPMMVEMFEKIGFGQWFRYVTGAIQVTGALLMLTPWTLTVGAAMLACTMVGAAFVDIFVMHAAGFALAPLALLGMVAAVWYAGRFGAGSHRASGSAGL